MFILIQIHMFYITRNLSLQVQGNDVALLHDTLAKIGYVIDSVEKKDYIFGNTTNQAVRNFQSKNGLPSTGIVDNATANKINEISQANRQNIFAEKVSQKVEPSGKGIIYNQEQSRYNRLSGNNKSNVRVKVPKSLLESQLFYNGVEDLNKLNKDESNYVKKKLSDYVQQQLMLLIGTVSDSLSQHLRRKITRTDYMKYIDSKFGQLVDEVLTDTEKDNKVLAPEISKIRETLSHSLSTSDKTVETLLGLKIPFKDNLVFADDFNTEMTLEYLKLAGLNPDTSDKVLKSKPDFNFTKFLDDELSDLIQTHIINEEQGKLLKKIASMVRLTGDNLKFVKLLANENINSLSDLISWKLDDWTHFILDHELPLPTNETDASEYASNIRFNMENTYPTQILLTSVGDSSKVSSSNSILLDSVNELLKKNDKLIESDDIAVTNWGAVTEDQKEHMKNSLQQLISFSNLYKHIGIQEIINNKTIDVTKKKALIKEAINLIKTFNTNNPELDLRLHNFFDKDEMLNLNWTGIPVEEQPRIRKQIMAYQRVLALSEKPAEHNILITKGYDSAMSIGRLTQHQFEKEIGGEMEPGRVKMIYFRSQEQLVRTAHNFEAIRDVTRGEFRHIAMSNINPLLVNDLLKIDGYADLFGPQSYCACEHCMSIFGPAAYFVDLMRFIDINISKPVFLDPISPLPNHPLYLKNRRTDLWNLQISCENTSTLIPYLTIVNEVLRSYLENAVPALGGDIFKAICKDSQDTKISFYLPFNLPFEEIQIYIQHFGISIFDIYKILNYSENKIWESKLGLTKEQLDVIATPDLLYVKFRYGNPPTLPDLPVEDFLNSTGLDREQLDELLKLRYNPDLGNILIEKEMDPDEPQRFKEILTNLENKRLDFIHRFTQLLRRTKWSIPELDMVLSALARKLLIDSSIELNAVIYVGKLLDIKENLNLGVEELCCMIDTLPVSSAYPDSPLEEKEKKLFERIFDIKGLFGVDPVTHTVNSQITFHHYSFNTHNISDTKVSSQMPLLLSGLGINEAELLLLSRLLSLFDDDGNCTLNLGTISMLYRHIRLARSLFFGNIQDFVTAVWICFIVPPKSTFVIETIDDILKIIEFKNWLQSSPFSVTQVSFILLGKEDNTTQFSSTLETMTNMVNEVLVSKDTDKKTALESSILKLFNISPDHFEKSLLPWVKTDKDSAIQKALEAPADLNPLVNLTHELERVMLIFSNLKFTEKTVAKVTQKKEQMAIINLKDLNLANLQSLTTYHKILDSMIVDVQKRDFDTNIGKLLDDYLVDLKFSDENIGFLSTLWNKNSELLKSISNIIALPNKPIDAVYYLWKLSNICQTLGINGSLLQKLGEDTEAGGDAGFAALSEARDIVLGSFSSKYPDEKIKEEKLGPYQDIINNIESKILSDYIIAIKKDLKFKNRNDIYSFFLLDSEMGGCARTSRIVSAISSLQLYVHRCLVNLEQSDPDLNPNMLDIHVDPCLIPQDQWEWRKNYRVWEANRKVFLYPENYLLPDLRDNKTPLFKELEAELLQQKITKETAEAACRKYLSELAELAGLLISGSYYHSDSGTYYFFGRTPQDPTEYYYREWIGCQIWTPWQKIELTINSNRISAIIYRGRLYIFWSESGSSKTTTVSGGASHETSSFTQYLLFSYLNESGKWAVPQRLIFFDSGFVNNNFIFPYVKENSIYAFAYDPLYISDEFVLGYKINQFKNSLGSEIRTNISDDDYATIPVETRIIANMDYTGQPGHQYYLAPFPLFSRYEAVIDFTLQHRNLGFDDISTVLTSEITDFEPEVQVVGYKPGDLILKLGDQQYLIRYYSGDVSGPYNPNPGPLNPSPNVIASNSNSSSVGINVSSSIYPKLLVISDSAKLHFINPALIRRRVMFRLGTSMHDRLGEILLTQGIEKFLSLETQKEHELPVGISFPKRFELSGPFVDTTRIDFYGAYGEYFRELFFHIPFLLAHSLNANQKFREAKWWYERIFDPTSNEPPSNPPLEPPTERNWRYIEFRNVTIQKMKSILTDQDAVLQYQNNPFNPHAIARLRISAYQKAIVMKYIDNLLDWADDLFAQDTVESINEALMLYILASNILGERPVKLGSCDSAMDESQNLTYQTIEIYGNYQSDFLITLENWHSLNTVSRVIAESGNANPANVPIKNIIRPEVDYYDRASNARKTSEGSTKKWEILSSDNQNLSHLYGVTTNSMLLFCIPENKDLLSYWDRVEDRLFKIRNCMNISGVHRTLALFQPPIDPMLLVRAKASGLALEDIIPISDSVLPYRFTYLVEKAKQFAQIVQNFGTALLGALEKKDTEELTLLRSVHERNILNITMQVKNKQLEDAVAQYKSAFEARSNVEKKIEHFNNLLENGLTGQENLQETMRNISSIPHLAKAVKLGKYASLLYLVPQVGSAFAMTFGGREKGGSMSAVSGTFALSGQLTQMISESAGIRANFDRREEEWNHQLLLAQQELKQMDQQVTASDIRVQIAQKEIEIHNKNIEQANELDEFYKNKFASLGLYNYLSTSMFRLYTGAYNLAYEMAVKAESAYKFEIDDETDSTVYIAPDNWQFERAGLLAGESLLLQLQRLEKAFIENNKHENEITQSFSLALLDPQALIDLKEKGVCEFTIHEIDLDCIYPGQYKRIVQAFRITIPALTGLIPNVNAKLSLIKSKIRYKADIPPTPIDSIPEIQKKISTTSISTSTAQNDTGTFEFSFRDERYLPFQGAGIVESVWTLELPKVIRSFDYQTISDVIFTISYTAKEDGNFRIAVENQIYQDLKNFATGKGLFRLVSLKHDFPSAFYKLLNPGEGNNQESQFIIGKNFFPYFLINEHLILMSATIYLKPKGKEAVNTNFLTFALNNISVNSGSWTPVPGTLIEGSIMESTIALSGQPEKTWTLDAGQDGFDKEKLDDILILIKYKIQS